MGQVLLSPAEGVLPHQLRVLGRHKAPLARHSGEKALPLQLLIGPLGGDDGNAQLLGQQPHGGQGLALLQLSPENEALHLPGDLVIDGYAAGIADDDVHGTPS